MGFSTWIPNHSQWLHLYDLFSFPSMQLFGDDYLYGNFYFAEYSSFWLYILTEID